METDAKQKPFDTPVAVTIEGGELAVASTRQALDLLSDVAWPGPRGTRHDEARDTCLKVLDGHRSTGEARAVFAAAAEEAGILRRA